MSTKPASLLATEPVAIIGALMAFLQSAFVVVSVFNIVTLDGQQQAAVQGLLTTGLGLIGAFYARGKSVSRATLDQLGNGAPPAP